ncbi:GNAT family N-acetyltransferase [Alkaliphilus hydrothermalis]|uniref:GNAT superfamily N-acetyltransferase n=1 Tax=Alkaliphilus hydrothermalis TaxID=1482730 RepID=A0ABS2NLJ1_9FIRM|nr:GNAT family N-acetyltransferase [Alkaliphilus hydrothermalis]MBM7613801.1 GNAT superfamily N-acetyltransferase [Alkaliphilus hydrothermalis]
MVELIKEAKEYKFNSVEYVELEDVKDILLYQKDESYIFLCGEDDSRLFLYWGASSKDDFFNGLIKTIALIKSELDIENYRAVYIEFIPEDFVAEMKKNNFEVVSNYVDYWIKDLATLELQVPEDPVIRPAAQEEYRRVSEITISCRNQSRGFSGETIEWVQENNEDPNSTVLVAEMNNNLVGMGCFKLYAQESKAGTCLWVRELAVDPQYQSKGVGGAILKHGLSWGIQQGAKRSFLAADEENRGAIRLYEKIGFKSNPDSGQINMELLL